MNNTLYNYNRKKLKNLITNNLGYIEETEKEIFCFINPKKLKKQKNTIKIKCKDINNKLKKKIIKYNLDKKIVYIFDKIDIKDKKILIIGDEKTEIIIKNCKFDYFFKLITKGKCYIENTEIKSFGMLSLVAKELTLKNFKINNCYALGTDLILVMYTNDSMNIINSFIGEQYENIKIWVNSGNKINIENSVISGKIIECKTKEILSANNSSINAEKRMNVSSYNIPKFIIRTPKLIYNENEIKTYNNYISLKEEKNQYKYKLLQLMEILKKIKKTKCNNSYEENNEENYLKILKKTTNTKH